MVEYLPIGLAAIAGTTYALRLEGRLNSHDQLFKEREKQADERHQDLKEDLRDIKDELRRLNGQVARQG